MSDINGKKCTEEPSDRLRELLFAQYGAEAERIAEGWKARRPTTLRANTLKTTAEEVAASLDRAGVGYERVPWYGDAFILRADPPAALVERGEVYLQSLSSMIPPLLLGVRAGESVLDMAAAPGGKTTEICALSGGKALVTACERDKIRFARLRFNLARQGASRVNAMAVDAGTLDPFFRFDKVLLDAPCSGSGTLSPASPGKFSEKLLAFCMREQRKLLRKGLSLLKKGGRLVYSTCSVLKQENEEALSSALAEGGARLVPVEGGFLSALPQLAGAEGTVTVCPDALFEGFFFAVLEKI